MDFSTIPVDVLRLIRRYKYEMIVHKRKQIVVNQLVNGYFRTNNDFVDGFLITIVQEVAEDIHQSFEWCDLCRKPILMRHGVLLIIHRMYPNTVHCHCYGR